MVIPNFRSAKLNTNAETVLLQITTKALLVMHLLSCTIAGVLYKAKIRSQYILAVLTFMQDIQSSPQE